MGTEIVATPAARHSATQESPKSVLFQAPSHHVTRLVLGEDGSEIPGLRKEPVRMERVAMSEDKTVTAVTVKKRPRSDEPWICAASKKSRASGNPVQSIIGQVTKRIRLGCQRADRKNPISLASGDAIAVGTMPPCLAAVEVVVKACLEKPHVAGYADACGTQEARLAIAKHHSYPETRIRSNDVIVTNGCSGALDLALHTLLDAGTTVLVPQPGFPLYEEIAKSIGANVVHYHLNPEKDWECDMEHLESIMSSHQNVRALVINNPSSATGAVFSETHLTQIERFAHRHQVPIVSDEIYGSLTFGSNRFIPMAQIAARAGRNVPVITTSGISKQFLLPGWRVGWLTFHDNVYNSLCQVKVGAIHLAQRNHGASSLAQAAVPTLLDPSTPGLADWSETLRLSLEERSQLLCRMLDDCPGLQVIVPQGAMYATIKIDPTKLQMEHDVEFAMRLVDEENVFVVPGTAMGVQNILRVSFCSPEGVLTAAARRIHNFCRGHAKGPDRVLAV